MDPYGKSPLSQLLRQGILTAGALEDLRCHPEDPELLHRYRTGLRRLRSLLEAADLPEPGKQQWASQLKAHFRHTSPIRDLDVLHQFLLEWGQSAPVLEKALEAQRHRQLKAFPLPPGIPGDPRLGEFLAWLETLPCGTGLSYSSGELFRESLEILSGTPLPDPGDDEALHRLRIRVKKIRYMLETLPEPPPEARDLVVLQDRLGEIRDLQVSRQLALSLAGGAVPASFLGWLEARHRKARDLWEQQISSS